MGDKDTSQFDAGAYWRERVGSDADLSVVGHRAMGAAYNGEIYARRIDAVESMLKRHVQKTAEDLRVLDIGCGSGFYTSFWKSRGVVNYVGIDISSRTIENLSAQYPDFKFVCADITEPASGHFLETEQFDVITIFDVLYHIVDNQRVEQAIRNVRGLIDDGGQLLIMDQLCKREYQVSEHVVYRERVKYLEMFRESNLKLTDSELLFHFLVPPITGIKIVDFLSAGVFKVFGLILQFSDRFAGFAASKIRAIDSAMRARGLRLPNCELFIFAYSSKTDT